MAPSFPYIAFLEPILMLTNQHRRDFDSMLEKMQKAINEDIATLHNKIKLYGSFNVVANSILRGSLSHTISENPFQHIVAEYLALITLKFPYSLGVGELTNANNLLGEFYEINRIAGDIIGKYLFIHYGKFSPLSDNGDWSSPQHIAQMLSTEELVVRNPTFEHFYWDKIEGIYSTYDDFFGKEFGFTVDEAIRICMTINDHRIQQLEKTINKAKEITTEMSEEIIAYKRRNKKPPNYYTPEHFAYFKTLSEPEIRKHFQEYAQTYQLTLIGETLSFDVNEILEMEEIDEEPVRSFLNQMSIEYGTIDPDFSTPELIHPLKDRPLIHHNGKFLCPSIALLDASLDRLFANALRRDKKLKEKFKDKRHDYLLQEGVKLLQETLQTDVVYTNLEYPGGEMDALIGCDNNLYFIEAKGHSITDRAKKGYLDRLEVHIDEIITAAHGQAVRTYNYLFGKKDVEFKDKQGRRVLIDGTQYRNAYFITLTLDEIGAISCNLKVNNSLNLFSELTFPWIVSLHDLRAVCEHMEGPSYFIHYLQRRKVFFNFHKFNIQDELDILGYFLKRNLRFEEIIEDKYEQSNILHLDSMNEDFNNYYDYVQGKKTKEVARMKHYTDFNTKQLIKALEQSGIPLAKDAGAEVLSFGRKTKAEIINNIKTRRKKYRKDKFNHDFRVGGNDNGIGWMFSYWIGKDHPVVTDHFERWVSEKFKSEPSIKHYYAIFDSGQETYDIKRVLYFERILKTNG